MLEAAGKAVEHSAAVLGAVTHTANNFQVSAQLADGAYCLTRHRDACPPAFENTSGRAARRRERRETDDAGTPQRPAQRPAQEQLLSATAAFAKGKAERAHAARQGRDDAAQARFAEAWLADRAAAKPSAAAPAQTARERLEALRRRVAEKAATRSAL